MLRTICLRLQNDEYDIAQIEVTAFWWAQVQPVTNQEEKDLTSVHCKWSKMWKDSLPDQSEEPSPISFLFLLLLETLAPPYYMECQEHKTTMTYIYFIVFEKWFL